MLTATILLSSFSRFLCQALHSVNDSDSIMDSLPSLTPQIFPESTHCTRISKAYKAKAICQTYRSLDFEPLNLLRAGADCLLPRLPRCSALLPGHTS